MNKMHSLVWSRAGKRHAAAPEAAAPGAKPSFLLKILAGALIAQASPAAPLPNALPTGGQVVAGSSSISQSGSTMTIQQSTAQTIINWQSFNIGSNATVNFVQPSSSAVALNRVVGSNPSSIYGSLNANGQVFLVNPNGVLFAPGAQVNVGALVASTLSITDANFLAGNYSFTRSGATADVTNQGTLLGRYVALLAPEVVNQGVIVAQMGTAALAAGDAVTLNITGNDLIGVQVSKSTINTLVSNQNLIQVGGGTVILSAQSANGLLGQVVNTGQVDANGVTSDGGVIRLSASSNIDNTGTLSANGAANGNGGTISAISDLSNPGSQTIVGGTLTAQGGSVSGNGGHIETSGTHLSIAPGAVVSTSAANGSAGTWLLDPIDFTIAASGGDITGAALSTALAAGSVTIQTTAPICTGATCGSGTAGNGDIWVLDAVTVAGNVLTLVADRNINVNAAITVTGGGGTIYFNYANSGSGNYTFGSSYSAGFSGGASSAASYIENLTTLAALNPPPLAGPLCSGTCATFPGSGSSSSGSVATNDQLLGAWKWLFDNASTIPTLMQGGGDYSRQETANISDDNPILGMEELYGTAGAESILANEVNSGLKGLGKVFNLALSQTCPSCVPLTHSQFAAFVMGL